MIEKVIHVVNVGRSDEVLWKVKRFSPKSDFKRSGASLRVPRGIMQPFYPRKEFALRRRFLVNECAEALFNDAVQYLNLAITLRVIRKADP